MDWLEDVPLETQEKSLSVRVNNDVFRLVRWSGEEDWWFYHDRFLTGNPVPFTVTEGESVGPDLKLAKMQAEQRIKNSVRF